MTEKITKAERAELRSVVRTQFKVLREEVEQRAAELHAEGAEAVSEKYAEIDQARATVERDARMIAQKALTDIEDLLAKHPETKPSPSQRTLLSYGGVTWQPDARYDLKGRAAAAIDQRRRDAQVGLKRQEADLLRDLAVDALETDAARAFLSGLPTAAALVPSVRLAELERSLEATA